MQNLHIPLGKVAPDATPAIVGIHSGAFAAQGTSAEDLGRVLTWDRLHNAGNGGMIESIRFDGSIPASVAAKAYLLNCPATQEHVELARLGFRINSFSPERPPKVSDFSEKGRERKPYRSGSVLPTFIRMERTSFDRTSLINNNC